MIKQILALIAMSLVFAVPAQAYQIDTKAGSSISTGISVNSYTVSGQVKTTTNSLREVYDQTGDIVTTGHIFKHSVVEMNVNQGGNGVGASGSATVYNSMTHGLIEVGASASVGYEASNSVDWNNSTIHETGTTRTDTNVWDVSGVIPQDLGWTEETVRTNTWVQLANVDYTTTVGGWSATSKWFK